MASFDYITVQCSTSVSPLRTIFTDRDLIVHFPERISPVDKDGVSTRGFVVDLSEIPNATDIALAGGSEQHTLVSERQRFLEPGREVRVDWRDAPHTQLRDVPLVLIGGLLGLAATCAIEWARP